MQGRVELISPKLGETWGITATYRYSGEGPFDGQEYVKSLPNLIGNPLNGVHVLDGERIQKNRDLLRFLEEERERQGEFRETTNDMRNLGVSEPASMEELANANPREQYMTLFAAGLEMVMSVRISNLLHMYINLFHFDRGVKLTPLSDALRYAQEERDRKRFIARMKGIIRVGKHRFLHRLGKRSFRNPQKYWVGIEALLEKGAMFKSRLDWDFQDPKARRRYIEEQEGLGLTHEQIEELIYAPYIGGDDGEYGFKIIRPQAV